MQVQQEQYHLNIVPLETGGPANISYNEVENNYTAILAIGQTPYQLGPFYRGGKTGWSWWDTGSKGTEKQKNLIELMVLDKTTGTIRPVTGLASKFFPTWPRATYRNHSGNFSYKADIATSPITTRINYPDDADIWMIKEVDLAGFSNANLSFWTWYSIEKDWDYGYVAVSFDGDTWNNLPGTLTNTTDPNGNNLGNGITGTSNGVWVKETMNLTQYTGNKIFLGFRFKTDAYTNYEGWYVDDINVTSGDTSIFNDDPDFMKTLDVNVTYPHLTLLNITDPLTNATILQYSRRTQQVNLLEDPEHPGTYMGYFLYDPFAEQYSGNYSIIFDTIINGSGVIAEGQFQTTLFGCQSCHNKKDSGNETSFVHNESGLLAGEASCMFMCHSGSRRFVGGPPAFMGPPNASNPMHVHEMQYGHLGGFLPGIFYQQPPYNIQSHVSTTTCSQCHTSFIHDNTGADSMNIANYTLHGTNISFSSGTHENLTCEGCHGNLTYPDIPQDQYQLQGTLGNYTPSFTSHESFTDTYIIAVNGTENLTITVNGNNTTKSIDLYSIGPVDNTSTALQEPCNRHFCYESQSLVSPMNVSIEYPFAGTWILKLIQLEGGSLNYTISSNYPIQEKPIIKIPECNSCHNSNAVDMAFTRDLIPDWNPGYAHADSNGDGKFDVQCRMCHNSMHDIIIKSCQTCHIAPAGHPIKEPVFSRDTQGQCLKCHRFAHNVSTEGGDDCLTCHTDDVGNYSGIDQAMFGSHINVNRSDGNNNLTNEDCKTCHYDFNYTEMVKEGFTTLTATCLECHISGNYSAPVIANHKPPKITNVTNRSAGFGINTTAYCSTCHNNSINKYGYSLNASVSHYGTNTSLVRTVNQTPLLRYGFFSAAEAYAYNKECNNCHNPPNLSYGAPTNITYGHTSTAACAQCHINVSADDLHNSSLGMPANFSCIVCHRTYADKYNAPNLTGTGHNGFDCKTSCHAPNFDYPPITQLDLQDHNQDWTSSKPPSYPATGIVYLNNATSLIVTKGTMIIVTSNISDDYTASKKASRVRGAEYYIDTDTGIGKGTFMEAVDGRFDAVNGKSENITGTIDTSCLSLGTHTVYVRGMDIGKLWSTARTATVTVVDTGYINGTVTEGVSPLIGVTVHASGIYYTTGSDGSYSLKVEAGTYTLTAGKQPAYYDNVTSGIVVTPSNTTIFNIELNKKPTGTIMGAARII